MRSTVRRLLAKISVERCWRNEFAEQTIDRRPNRFLRQRPKLLDRTDHSEIEILAQAGVDDGYRPLLQQHRPHRRSYRRESGRLPSSGRCVADRPIRTNDRATERFEPFEQQRQEYAPFVGAQRMNFIDDAIANAGENAPRLGGQQ